MSERIKGITIEFDGDVSGLKKALNSVNKSARATNTALKDVNKALKMNPNNVQLLSQKQQLLRRRTEEVTDKLQIMKMQLEQMKNDPSVDKKGAEFQKLQREIIKAEAYQKQFAREMVKFGNARLNAVGGSLQTIGRRLTNITKGARMAAGALAGIALYKGFERLKTLDSVSTELQKLGYQGRKLEQIMDAAKGSVSGTTFALTDMSKVAKGALGAGVESQYSLDEYLGRVADLAAVGGISVEKMGAMMNKALSKGTVDAKLLNQMNANGIPIYRLLADSMGVTTEELTKLVSQGKVGFDDLYQATAKYQGLAQELGTETLSGAITVLGQQFGLIGADFLSGAYEPIKEGVQGIVSKLKELQSNGTIKEWGTAVGEAIKYFVQYFKEGEVEMGRMSEKAQGLVTAFSPVVTFIGKLIQLFMALPNWLKLAAAGFALFGGPLLTFIGGITKLIGMIPAFIQLTQIVGGVGKAFMLLTGVNPIILGIVAGIAALVAVGVLLYKNWDSIKAQIISIWNNLKSAVSNAVNVIKTTVTNNFNTLKNTVSRVWNAIKTAITTPINAARDAVDKAVEKMKGALDKVKNIGKTAFKILSGLKWPHISISGGKLPFGIGGKGTRPHIDVTWNRKAMWNPYIFDGATLFGAGEAGDEVLYGRNALMRDIAEAVATASLGGVVINVYGADGMSVNDLASAVEQKIIQMQKRRTQAWA